MFGGKTLLKWNDPRTLKSQEAHGVPLWKRVWGRKGVWTSKWDPGFTLTFAVLYICWGFLGHPLIDFGTGWAALIAELCLSALVWLAVALIVAFPLSYLIDLAPQPIQIRERAISHFGKSKRWPFTRLGAYSVQPLEAGKEHIRVLALYNHSGELKVGLEIAPEVSDEQIAEALRGRLPHRTEFKPLPGCMHRF